MKRFARVGTACLLASLFAWPVLAAGKPKPKGPKLPEIEGNRLVSANKVTFWYYLKPVARAQLQVILQKSLAHHGLHINKQYWLDRDDATHMLTVTASPQVAALIQKLLAQFEEKEPQIRVSVRIVETSTTADFQTGLDVSLDRKTSKETFFRGFELNFSPKDYLDNLSKTTTTVPFQGASTMFGTVDANGNVIDQKQYDRVGAVFMALRALSAYQRADILAQPDILVTNGQKARVSTGGRFPYQTSTLSGSNVTISTQFLTTGITLEVTPHLVGVDSVHLQVMASVENVAGYVEGAQGVQNPFTNKRDITTKVLLESGAELVMGGLFTREHKVVEKGLPVLSEIPILGLLFKSYWKTTVKKELLFFIRPKIVKARSKFIIPGK